MEMSSPQTIPELSKGLMKRGGYTGRWQPRGGLLTSPVGQESLLEWMMLQLVLKTEQELA